MKRRTHLKALLVAPLGLSNSEAQSKAAKPIHLFAEMQVDPAREKEMLDNFHTPAAGADSHGQYALLLPLVVKKRMMKNLDIKRMMKFQKVMQGDATPTNYRFELEFESEALRQKWINSPEHKRVWPTVEKFIKSQKDYPVVLYDEV